MQLGHKTTSRPKSWTREPRMAAVIKHSKRTREEEEEDAEFKRARVGDDEAEEEEEEAVSDNEAAASEEEEAGSDNEDAATTSEIDEAGNEEVASVSSEEEEEELTPLTPKEKKALLADKRKAMTYNNMEKVQILFCDKEVDPVGHWPLHATKTDVKKALKTLKAAIGKYLPLPFVGQLRLPGGLAVRAADMVQDVAASIRSSATLPEYPSLKDVPKENRAGEERAYLRKLTDLLCIVPCGEDARGALCLPVTVRVKLTFKNEADVSPLLAGKKLDVEYDTTAYYLLARCTESRFSKQYNETPCRHCKPYFFDLDKFYESAKASAKASAAAKLAVASMARSPARVASSSSSSSAAAAARAN